MGKTLKGARDGKGYRTVVLADGEKKKTFRVHRLVAAAFLGGDQPDMQVNHIDGNKWNNSAENLEWCTDEQNKEHARRIGLAALTDEKTGRWLKHGYGK